MASNVKSLSGVIEKIQTDAEIASGYALALHIYGNEAEAERWKVKAWVLWEQWAHLKALTRLIGQVQELRAITRSEVMQ